MRPVVKEELKESEFFERYQDAKPRLIENLGSYCSYCEIHLPLLRNCDVEHVQPKGYKDRDGNLIYANLETDWSNFLLSCSTCNGPDNKGVKNVLLGECHLPHLNNTFLSLEYLQGGAIIVNRKLTGDSKKHAENLLKLVGLCKGKKDSLSSDNRWKIRLESWNTASRYLKKYENDKIDKSSVFDSVLDLVKTGGMWSIWFTVFKDHDEVRKALIDEFPGTAKECFDANNQYEPIERNPGKPDPV